jgi:hypothetical protein
MAALNLGNVPRVTKCTSQEEHYVVGKGGPCQRASPEYRAHTKQSQPQPPLLVTVSLRALGLEASVPIMMNTQNGTHYKDPRDPTV